MRSQIKPGRLSSLLCVLAISALVPCVFARTNSPPAKNNAKAKTEAPGGNRFLFIVDTSASMQPFAKDVAQAVDEIIQSSASGQLHRGDTLGVWTFNAQLFPGVLPLQTWVPEDKSQIAARTEQFLGQLRYGQSSRLAAALDGMFTVIKDSDIITVFIISSGQSPMQGTPFDQQINAQYVESVKEMKKKRKPIVTVLQAKRGKIIQYTVNALPWPVVIPEVPIPIKGEETAAATPATNVAKPTPPPVIAQNPPPTATPAPKPIPIPRPPEPVKPEDTQSQTTATAAPTPLPAPHPVVGQPQPAVPPPAPTQAAAAPPAHPLPPPVVNQPMPPRARVAMNNGQPAMPPPPAPKPAVHTNAPTVAATVPAAKPATNTATAAAITSTGDTNRITLHTIAAVVTRPKFLLIGALITAAIGLGLIALLISRSRTVAPSLITRTMGNPPKK